MGTNEGEEEDEEEGEFVIPPEQYEQDMQAEDEQYIQAGNDALSGQQVETPHSYSAHLIRKIISFQLKLSKSDLDFPCQVFWTKNAVTLLN